jgi:hypothetical protein
MPHTHPKQLSLEFGPRRDSRDVVLTRALQGHRSCARTLERVRYVRRYFPELAGVTIKVGLTRAASGMAIPGGNEVWFNPSRVTNHTVAHEFTHLLQRTDLGIPQGEKSCDVFALARHWTLNDVRPDYVRVPSSIVEKDGTLRPAAAMLVYDAAAAALARRREGLRRYIAYFESRLRDSVTLLGREARGAVR